LTGKANFTAEEWDVIAEGPATAGMIVSTAERGGSFREAFAMAKAYAEARQDHGASELLDEIVSSRPDVDRAGARSPEELREGGLRRIREAVGILERKAGPEELEAYRAFVASLARRVADAKQEKGEGKGGEDPEAAAVAQVEAALGLPTGQPG
jgi:hypothetical protein